MADKPLKWQGASLDDLKDRKIFPESACREAGRQLRQIQKGLDPDHWKPFPEVGPGTREIIIDEPDGWYRVLHVAKFPEAIYVLHCFKKKTNTTTKQDKEIASKRYQDVVKERSKP